MKMPSLSGFFSGRRLCHVLPEDKTEILRKSTPDDFLMEGAAFLPFPENTLEILPDERILPRPEGKKA